MLVARIKLILRITNIHILLFINLLSIHTQSSCRHINIMTGVYGFNYNFEYGSVLMDILHIARATLDSRKRGGQPLPPTRKSPRKNLGSTSFAGAK